MTLVERELRRHHRSLPHLRRHQRYGLRPTVGEQQLRWQHTEHLGHGCGGHGGIGVAMQRIEMAGHHHRHIGRHRVEGRRQVEQRTNLNPQRACDSGSVTAMGTRGWN